MAALLTVLAFATSSDLPVEYAVWPPPRDIRGSGTSLDLHPEFSISAAPINGLSSKRLDRAVDRCIKRLSRPSLTSKNISASTPSLKYLRVSVENSSEYLGVETDYSYSLSVSGESDTAEVHAKSVYGAMYALESFWQLVDSETATLRYSSLTLTDAPENKWRGIMIDAGRRFFPMDTVKNLLDTMAGTKLNVLHLHASDMCRFGVESKIYPNLTNALTDDTCTSR